MSIFRTDHSAATIAAYVTTGLGIPPIRVLNCNDDSSFSAVKFLRNNSRPYSIELITIYNMWRIGRLFNARAEKSSLL
jgi:hypothetical protein